MTQLGAPRKQSSPEERFERYKNDPACVHMNRVVMLAENKLSGPTELCLACLGDRALLGTLYTPGEVPCSECGGSGQKKEKE